MRSVFKVLFTFIILVAGVSCALALDQKDVKGFFADAVKAYHAGHYEQAVRLNEMVLARGYSSPALYYNLGNAHIKSGHLGKAVVNYLRAQYQTPRDSDLRSNLLFARSLVENYSPWPRNSFFGPIESFFNDRELLWVGFTVFALTGAFFLGGLYMGMRHKRLVLGTVLLMVATVYLAGAGILRTVDRSGAAVCISKVEAKFEPNEQATTYFKVPEGTEIKVLRVKEGWAKVERPDGKLGWVPVIAAERI